VALSTATFEIRFTAGPTLGVRAIVTGPAMPAPKVVVLLLVGRSIPNDDDAVSTNPATAEYGVLLEYPRIS
jgi:hypothetical protein